MKVPTTSLCMADPPLRAAYCTMGVCCLSSLAELQPNAAHQARGMAGARNERTLFPVACMRLLGTRPGTDSPLASPCPYDV